MLFVLLFIFASICTAAVVTDKRRVSTDPANRTAQRTGAPFDAYAASSQIAHHNIGGGGTV